MEEPGEWHQLNHQVQEPREWHQQRLTRRRSRGSGTNRDSPGGGAGGVVPTENHQAEEPGEWHQQNHQAEDADEPDMTAGDRTTSTEDRRRTYGSRHILALLSDVSLVSSESTINVLHVQPVY